MERIHKPMIAILTFGLSHFLSAQTPQQLSLWATVGYEKSYLTSVFSEENNSPLFQSNLTPLFHDELTSIPVQTELSHTAVEASAEYRLTPSFSFGLNTSYTPISKTYMAPVGIDDFGGRDIIGITLDRRKLLEVYASYFYNDNAWSLGTGINKNTLTVKSLLQPSMQQTVDYTPHIFIAATVPLNQESRAQVRIFSTLLETVQDGPIVSLASSVFNTSMQYFSISHGVQCSLSYQLN